MKRKMLLFTLALPVILCQNAQAQTTSSRLVGMAHSANNGASFTPVDSTDYVYSGNRGGDLNNMLKYDNSTTWNFEGDTAYGNTYMYLQTFDGNNNILTSITEYWSGTDWVLATKNLYTYDISNMVTSMVKQSWGGTAWVPVAQDVYTYIGTKLVEDQYQIWDSLTSTFSASSQKNYYYDPISGLNTNITSVIWISGVPVNQSENAYTYTGSMLATTTYSTWDGATWDPVTMNTNTYDSAGNRTNMLYQTYNAATTSWVNQNLDLYSGFTSAHNPLIDVKQVWDTTGGGTWDNVMQYANTYNAYNQLTSSTGQSWNIVGAFEFALNDPMADYYYETYSTAGSNTSVTPVASGNDGVNVYPVPAQNTLHVDLTWMQAQTATIAIYDMTGRVVNQWQSTFGVQYASAVSVNLLAPGTYIVKINGSLGQQIVKQFVVAH